MLNETTSITEQLSHLLAGQSHAVSQIAEYVEVFQAGLSPEGRPAGVAMLLGPTGTGKTHTVESLAKVLHGSTKHLLRIDCAEFQSDHEIAKLIGSPPGYLGHRETQPLLSQAKLNGSRSDECELSLLLLDEIEKAAPSFARLLFGILDKATLRLGDNSVVNFENTFIFMTSNLGAEGMLALSKPVWGFDAGIERPTTPEALLKVGMRDLKHKFGNAFVGRLDIVAAYNPLTRADCDMILTEILAQAGSLIARRRNTKAFRLAITQTARERLLDLGTSVEFGARELRRTVEKYFLHPAAKLAASGQIPPGGLVVLDEQLDDFSLSLRYQATAA